MVRQPDVQLPASLRDPSGAPESPRVTVCAGVNLSATVSRAKVYIDTLPVWSSTPRGREGSIPEYLCMKSFLADGDRISPPGLKMMEILKPAAEAGYQPGPSVMSEEVAGGEA